MNPILKRAMFIFAISLIIYTIPSTYNAFAKPFFHTVPSQDVVSASLVPISILTRGNFFLDQYRRYIANNYPEQHIAVEFRGHFVSVYPVAAGILSLPSMGLGLGFGWISRTDNVFDIAKLTAAFIATLASVAFFFAAKNLTDLSSATLVTIGFALGSSVWSTASLGLWQHTPSLLFQAIALWFLTRPVGYRASTVAPAGLFLSLATVARPPNLVTALISSVYVAICFRSTLWKFLLWALPPLMLFLSYNATVNGSPFVFGYQGDEMTFAIPGWFIIEGLLFSPSRGLFFYSPFLMLAPFGLWNGWLSEKKNFYNFLAFAFVGYATIMVSWGSLGGWAYGPRMLTDVLPAGCLLIIPAVEKIRGVSRGVLWIVVAFGVFLQSLGIWDYGLRFHSDPTNDVNSFVNNEPLFYMRLYFSMIQAKLGL